MLIKIEVMLNLASPEDRRILDLLYGKGIEVQKQMEAQFEAQRQYQQTEDTDD